MSSSSRSAPWQFEWKRPQWQTPSASDGDASNNVSMDGNPISTASAQVTTQELSEWRQDDTSDNDSFSENTLVLTATLYSTGKASAAADILVLQVIQQSKGGDVTRTWHRKLRWPGSLEQEEKSWFHWKKKQQDPVGLVCVTLCRLPQENASSALVDAMDVVDLMSLGLASSTAPSRPTAPTAPTSSETADDMDDKKTTNLVLALLTTDGRVLVYSPQTLFHQESTNCNEMEDGFVSFLMGANIHQQLQESLLPLCQPLAVVSLSVPLKSKNDDETKLETTIEANEDVLVITSTSVWQDSYWDANIEASSAMHHTMDNVATILTPAFEYLAVSGHGTRTRRIRKRKELSSSRASSVSSFQSGDEDNAPTAGGSGKEWWKDKEASASSSSASLEKKEKTRWFDYKETGGFVTFVSLHHYAETRTVYIPFAPKKLSAIVWGGMHFVVILGDESLTPYHNPLAVAIRVDSFDISTIPVGEAPSIWRDPVEMPSAEKESGRNDKKQARPTCTVRRFHLLPIILPIKENVSSVTTIAVSSTTTDPPGIALLCASEPEMSGDLLVTLCTLQVLDLVPASQVNRVSGVYYQPKKSREKALAIKTELLTRHAARIPHQSPPATTRFTWGHLGQGWSLIGVDDDVFFVCWEGASASQGAFVSRIHSEEEYESKRDTLTTLRLTAPVLSCVLPLREQGAAGNVGERRSSFLQLPFTSPYRMPSFVTGQGRLDSVDETDDIVADALQSLSSPNVMSEQPKGRSRSRRQSLSHREKSVRLVRKCSSWALLDDTKENKTYYDNQVPVLMVHLGPLAHEHFILSLRKVVIDNMAASPFNQVLGWLSQSRDYFTAASVALDLLHDADSRRSLRRESFEDMFNDNRANREGLLDGIVPLYTEAKEDSADKSTLLSPPQSILTQLADMTVGCLLKGGISMSSTLENFLSHDLSYDAGRACLMLVSAAVSCFSSDTATVKSVMGAGFEWPQNGVLPADYLIWPLKCLLRVGVARDYLPTILLLLNAAIPDELRGRGRDGASASSPESLDICKSVVSMIVASSAAELLLGLEDEMTGKRYWSSLEHQTQLELALTSIDGAFPLLYQIEVRNWILSEMDKLLQSNATSDDANAANLPNDWLQSLSEACLANVGCELDHASLENPQLETPERFGDDSEHDGVQEHLEARTFAIEALTASTESGGLDYDLLIPALLLLVKRSLRWPDSTFFSTQDMLDAACYLAGRHGSEEPKFAFDGPRVMKQCALSGNVSAGANLIGGKNGLVLKCCDVLMKGADVSMDDAEDYILSDDYSKNATWRRKRSDNNDSEETPFVLTSEHRHVLWLFDEHVLSVTTFGDFDTTHVHGKVDPVFAARSCFRTWFLLSLKRTTQATAWLVSWLRHRLGISPGQVSRKRLACSALTCALMWPTTEDVDVGEIDTSSDAVLANALNVESLFLVQISQASCGLVECVPPSFADEVLRQVEASEASSTRRSTLQVDV